MLLLIVKRNVVRQLQSQCYYENCKASHIKMIVSLHQFLLLMQAWKSEFS